jgi:hypothetical protein
MNNSSRSIQTLVVVFAVLSHGLASEDYPSQPRVTLWFPLLDVRCRRACEERLATANSAPRDCLLLVVDLAVVLAVVVALIDFGGLGVAALGPSACGRGLVVLVCSVVALFVSRVGSVFRQASFLGLNELEELAHLLLFGVPLGLDGQGILVIVVVVIFASEFTRQILQLTLETFILFGVLDLARVSVEAWGEVTGELWVVAAYM